MVQRLAEASLQGTMPNVELLAHIQDFRDLSPSIPCQRRRSWTIQSNWNQIQSPQPARCTPPRNRFSWTPSSRRIWRQGGSDLRSPPSPLWPPRCSSSRRRMASSDWSVPNSFSSSTSFKKNLMVRPHPQPKSRIALNEAWSAQVNFETGTVVASG